MMASTVALAAMSCAVPGVWLVLRRDSMMGDALSHTALPGIVVAFLVVAFAKASGWLDDSTVSGWLPVAYMVGAVFAGMATAWLTELVERIGKVESNAALGVVFTSLFALGLFLIRFKADSVDLDVNCVLFGNDTDIVFDTVTFGNGWEIPRAAIVNGVLLMMNVALTALFFKELRITAFDPGLASSVGINPRLLHYGLMAATAVTIVAAFTTVGSILVIGLLITPAAVSRLLTDRLRTTFAWALGSAAVAGIVGHWLSQTAPAWIFPKLGLDQIRDVPTSGSVAVTIGLIFLLAWIFSPKYGLLSRGWNRILVLMRIAGEDVLGSLYRREESALDANYSTQPDVAAQGQLPSETSESLRSRMRIGPFVARITLWWLSYRRLLVSATGGYSLTDGGRELARKLVRSHRLWESYLDHHFEIPAGRLHTSAHRAEHYLDESMRERISEELDAPSADPHGRSIPEETPSE